MTWASTCSKLPKVSSGCLRNTKSRNTCVEISPSWRWQNKLNFATNGVELHVEVGNVCEIYCWQRAKTAKFLAPWWEFRVLLRPLFRQYFGICVLSCSFVRVQNLAYVCDFRVLLHLQFHQNCALFFGAFLCSCAIFPTPWWGFVWIFVCRGIACLGCCYVFNGTGLAFVGYFGNTCGKKATFGAN